MRQIQKLRVKPLNPVPVLLHRNNHLVVGLCCWIHFKPWNKIWPKIELLRMITHQIYVIPASLHANCKPVSYTQADPYGTYFPPACSEGHGGLVVRCRPWGQRVPGSKPDSTEGPLCIAPVVP
ncbi:hypothetical protein AVEN_18806-1 [Araneus ventricosus]|uniref:Uncharacterized protein n=1 Tax=Araneus ventricosus TaxID=182803 RepID=A0A4Y2PW46_ARAVE|nr:hypothetical protein AVEN_18806-1 [Araneus ventricosus]